jgi:hypothetical protein
VPTQHRPPAAERPSLLIGFEIWRGVFFDFKFGAFDSPDF